jgi:isoquinoline 1-oxidoreductase subunit beta
MGGREDPRVHAQPSVTRRRFLAGSALIVGFALAKEPAAAEVNDLRSIGAYDAAASGFEGFVPDGFIRIGTDGRIVLVAPSVEMGQGIATGEAMLIAEELEVGLDQVEVAIAPPDPLAYNQSILKGEVTGGSTSMRAFFTPLRQAGAAAREMLIAAAAEAWQVPTGECRADRAVVIHSLTGRRATYAELAVAAGKQKVPQNVALKAPADFKIIGKPLKRVDTPAKVNGKTQYGIDVHVEGLRHAAVLMTPTIGGRVRSVDEGKVRSLPGIVDVLRIDDAIAVVGTSYWIARKGLEEIQVEWDEGANALLSTASILDDLKNAQSKPIIGGVKGDPDRALANAVERLDAIYELPYLAHASLEPINTTIHVRKDSCDVWVGTQVPETARLVVSEVVGLPPEKIMVYNHMIGGGFGRRLAVDTIQQAARFARQVDYPLKLLWTREQDIQQDHFRPMYYDRIAAGLDTIGRPVAFTHP